MNFKNLIKIEGLLSLSGSIGLLISGFPGFYRNNFEKFNKLGFTGLIVASAGLILYACMQYYETPILRQIRISG